MAAKQKGKRAWVITWEHLGEHAKPPKSFVAAFSNRRSPEWIKKFVQITHDMEALMPSEILYHLDRQGTVPYKTQEFSYKGIPVMDKFTCGHNPHVFGRLVNNLRVVERDGVEVFEWDEIKPEDYPFAKTIDETANQRGH